MNISNARYFHDRQRHDLALRMIRHEARTRTIRRCTGLTDDRIRRLYKTYIDAQAVLPIRRRRGRSPRQVAYFTRNAELQFEASFLANLFAAFGLLRDRRSTLPEQPPLELGEVFCDAFETHRQLLQSASISFEHAWFLLQLLNRGEQLRITHCRQCRSDYLHDLINLSHRACPTCARSQQTTKVTRTARTKAKLEVSAAIGADPA